MLWFEHILPCIVHGWGLVESFHVSLSFLCQQGAPGRPGKRGAAGEKGSAVSFLLTGPGASSVYKPCCSLDQYPARPKTQIFSQHAWFEKVYRLKIQRAYWGKSGARCSRKLQTLCNWRNRPRTKLCELLGLVNQPIWSSYLYKTKLGNVFCVIRTRRWLPNHIRLTDLPCKWNCQLSSWLF